MLKKIVSLLVFLYFVSDARCQQADKGVSYSLAVKRHQFITQLSYRLLFDIPADKSENIIAAETLFFNLADASTPLLVDFRQDTSHIQSMVVNGRPASINLQNEHLVIEKQYLLKGHNTISIHFIAGNESLNRNNDYLYALFVPDRARTAFPCFDQPDLKATFTLTLIVPTGWTVLANAGIKDSSIAGTKTTYRFTTSDLLPTYLFSFTAGKYTVADQPGMRFLYRETDTAKLRLSVDSIFRAHRDAISFLQDWTGIAFPFQKIGFAAIPSFQFGGMEHPGEVQYNAAALFLDDGATKDQLIARSNVISHETAHMWFGDMVTIKWFNDVWMKEVFANFMADKVTEKLMGTETFNIKFLLDHTPASYNIDRTRGANPIRQQLVNLQDAGSLYGNIIYHKAPVMMRQLELLMGKNNFRKGVQEYLQKYKFSNAGWNDLITILRKHTTEDLISWNKTWVNRAGRPVFSYQYKDKKIIITQIPERGLPTVWPERFGITLMYPGNTNKNIDVNMNRTSVAVPVPVKPAFVLFNSDGRGYGLFPAVLSNQLYQFPDPLQRAAAYINVYENMLAGRGIKANELLDFCVQGLIKENSELNLRLLCGYLSSVFWSFSTPEDRLARSISLEQSLWAAISAQKPPNNKKIIFKTYQDIYLGSEAGNRIYEIWKTQKAPDNVKLTEDDYTALALTIALKTDTVNSVLQQQLVRITNADRKARLLFMLPALSPNSMERDKFFISLQDINNRRHEAWVTAALGYLNHPLRQYSFIKSLPAALDMLQEVQRTGDVFFPQNWLGAIFSGHQTKEAWQAVEVFLNKHPGYNPKLKAKILQATDNLYRAQKLLKN